MQLLGRVLHDTYRIESLLGRGGMGEVYLATHLRLPRRFAVKVLYAFGPAHSQEVTRFRREAEVVSSLGHPHIVEVMDFNHTPEGAPYIVMELLEGEDLATRLKRVGRLSLVRTALILRQAASALHAAHQRGVIHRDLKPRNIFLSIKADQKDWVKVVDFGLSKVTGAHTQVTNAQMAIGTPRYMSPEQALGYSSKADARSDVFAMGGILYRSLSGQLPFRGNTVQTVLYGIVHLEPPPLTEAVPGLPPAVAATVARALSKDPNARYQSMEDLSRAFHEAAGIAWPDSPILSEEGLALASGERFDSSDSSSGSQRSRSARTHSAPTDLKARAARRGSSRPVDPMEGTELLAVGPDDADDEVITAGADDDELDDPLTAVAESQESESAIPLTSADLSATYASGKGELSQPPPLAMRETLERPSPRARRQRAVAILASLVVLLAVGVTLFAMRAFKAPRPLVAMPDASARFHTPRWTIPTTRPLRPDAAVLAPDLSRLPDLAPPRPPEQKRVIAPPPVARYGQLRVVTQIDGAMAWAYVSVDGRRIDGQTPLKIPRLSAGQHSIRVERRGYRPIAEKVRIRAGQLTKVTYELRR